MTGAGIVFVGITFLLVGTLMRVGELIPVWDRVMLIAAAVICLFNGLLILSRGRSS